MLSWALTFLIIALVAAVFGFGGNQRIGFLHCTNLADGSLLWRQDSDDWTKDQNLVIADGHIYPQVDAHPEFGLTYAQRNLLLENTGDGRFADATDRSGPGFALVQPSHGLAAGDYDDDGDLDLLISNLDGPPNLLRNDSNRGSYLTVALEVPAGRGTAIGTRVEAGVGDRTLVRDVSSSESFLSVNDPRLHFGLGNVRSVDRLEVFWAVDVMEFLQGGDGQLQFTPRDAHVLA